MLDVRQQLSCKT